MTNSKVSDIDNSGSNAFKIEKVKLPWLGLLLDAYEIIDRGVRTAIQREVKKHGRKLACKKGCSNCCKTHKDIPVYPSELVGIYWYAIEKITQPIRQPLKKQLAFHKKPECPFLVNGDCSIYPLRPVACRQFNVFTKECEKKEDPYHTRRGDVLSPIKDYTEKAFYVMLPFYGIINEKDKKLAIKNNLIHAHAQNLHSINWKLLSKRMDDFDAKNL